ncbi:MAG: hypothetical protein HY579_00100 [Nitrospinae bacterium]|nr:hypothetical protein [Nitrospinota bacterium]
MSLKNLEKIEELFDALAGETRALRDENRQLKEEIEKLGSEVEAVSSKEEKVQSQLEKLKTLQSDNHKMESNKAALRLKVQNMLFDLEKIDWM